MTKRIVEIPDYESQGKQHGSRREEIADCLLLVVWDSEGSAGVAEDVSNTQGGAQYHAAEHDLMVNGISVDETEDRRVSRERRGTRTRMERTSSTRRGCRKRQRCPLAILFAKKKDRNLACCRTRATLPWCRHRSWVAHRQAGRGTAALHGRKSSQYRPAQCPKRRGGSGSTRGFGRGPKLDYQEPCCVACGQILLVRACKARQGDTDGEEV